MVPRGLFAGVNNPNWRHGMRHASVYHRWRAMIQRCTNPNSGDWKDYGGRGISICERWRSFDSFYADMGDPPKGTSLERLDVHGPYSPDNCAWASKKQQARNTRASHFITRGGETLTLVGWAERRGISRYVLSTRLLRGWSVETAFSRAVRRSPLHSHQIQCLMALREAGVQSTLIARFFAVRPNTVSGIAKRGKAV